MSALPQSSNGRRLFWIILLAGLAVRLLLSAELYREDTGLERLPPKDMWSWHAQAELVVAGDFLLRGAEELLIEEPTCLLYVKTPQGRERYHRAVGAEPLVHAPLYTYLIATSLLLTDSPWPVRWAQVLATLLVAWLTYLLARAVCGDERVGLLAMGLVAFHPTSAFYAGFLLRATLITALLTLLLLIIVRYLREPRAGAAFGLGCLLGLIYLTKAMVPLLAPLLLPIFPAARGSRRRRAQHALLAALGLLLVSSPLVARNLACGTRPFYGGGGYTQEAIALYNFEGADGVRLVRPPTDYLHALIVKGDTVPGTLLAAIDTHPSCGAYLRLEARKLQGFWNGHEASNNLNYNLRRHQLRSLALFPVSTHALLPLALLGLLGTLREWRRLWPLHALVAVMLGFCLVAAALARFRLPVIPCLAIYAALGVRLIWRHRESARRTALHALAVVALLLATHPGALAATARASDPPLTYEYAPHQAWAALAGTYQRLGKAARARDYVLRAVLEHPVSRDPEAWGAADRATRVHFIRLHDWAYRVALEANDREGARAVLLNLLRFADSRVVRERLRALEAG